MQKLTYRKSLEAKFWLCCCLALIAIFGATNAHAEAGGQDNFCVCHNTNSPNKPQETIVVARPALCTHVRQHGDTPGPCSPSEISECRGFPGFQETDCPPDGPATCGEEPADIVLMLDRTGSVSTTNRNQERDAARDFIDAIATLNNGSRIAVGRFGDANDGGTEAEIRASLSTNYSSLKTAVTNALSSSSSVGTNLRDAINVSQKELDDNGTFNKRVIVLLSDGDANEPGTDAQARAAAEAAATTAKGKGTIIITVAFDASGSGDGTFRASLASQATQPSDDDSSGSVDATEKNLENADGDYFMIASTGADLQSIFLERIFETIRCDDKNPCTRDTCDEEVNQCEFELIPDCRSCEGDEDCNDGNACNGQEKCGENDTCQPGTPPVCEDNNACTANACDPEEGCVSNPVDCSDPNPCTADSCDPVSGCQNIVIEGCQACESDADCDNKNACDGKETCGPNGTCLPGTPLTCDDGSVCTADSCDPVAGCLTKGIDCNDNNACTAESCDPKTGCAHNPVACDDANACTANACDPDKGCVFTPVSCDDANPCTVDSCDAVNGCKHEPIPGCQRCDEASDCNNNNACDGVETCGENGTCVGGTPPDCKDEDACTVNSCDPVKGCVTSPTVCGDENACTRDGCDSKSGCTYTPISCDDSNACTAESCDEDTGCETTPISCDDADACTADSCDPQTGCAHNTVSCDDRNPCTADSCDRINGCQHDVIEGCTPCDGPEDCNNNNVCDGAEFCGANGTCQSGTPPVCADDSVCTNDSCDPIAGCLNNPISCDDGNACTAESCDPSDGCQHASISCDDSNACTADACDPKTGCSHVSVSCEDNNPCTVDSCDAINGCQHDVIEGCTSCDGPEDCNNSNACDGIETCGEGGTCIGGTPPLCEDDNACTANACDPATGCTSTSVICEDSNACTADSCNSTSGCVHETISCDDNNACTADACDEKSGCTYNAVNCEDNNPCTVDSCDAVNGCQHEMIEGCQACDGDEACNNNNACDGAEFCGEDGTCQAGSPPQCNDGNPCTVDSCNAESGCSNTPIVGCQACESDSDCIDGDLCNGTETCGEGGVCLAGSELDCNDSNPCTRDSCNPGSGCSNIPDQSGPGCGPSPNCPDADGDSVCDEDDNCKTTPNPDQADSNQNDTGDACEEDGDDSGVDGGPVPPPPAGAGPCLQGSGSNGEGDSGCKGFACTLNQEVPVNHGPTLGTILVLGFGLLPWLPLWRKAPGRFRRSPR